MFSNRFMLPGLVLMLAAIACQAFDFDADMAVSMQGFRTQGHSEGGTTWSLVGANAVIRGGVCELKDVTLVMNGADGRKTTIRSPECTYNQSVGLIESEAPVHVVGDDLDIRGIGYDILMKEKKLRIRNRVRMEVAGASRSVLQPVRTPPKETMAP